MGPRVEKNSCMFFPQHGKKILCDEIYNKKHTKSLRFIHYMKLRNFPEGISKLGCCVWGFRFNFFLAF